MSSHYDSKKSKEAARDIGDKIFKLQPFDALGMFVLCLLLSFVWFFVGGMSLMLIDYIFGIYLVETINKFPYFAGYIIIMIFGAFVWTILIKLDEKYGKKY